MRANVQLYSLLLVGCANFQFIAARALRPNAMIVGMNIFFHGYRPPFMLIDKSALYHFCAIRLLFHISPFYESDAQIR